MSYKLPAPFQQSGAVTISYDYDPLYRLKEANYSTGDYYHYGYDAVGNRLNQDTQVGGLPITTTYLYDDANRVQSVSGITYTFDANGNLLNDGINTYTYDSANRLKTVNSGSVTASYTYNGTNDRLQETVNGNTTTFTMDLNTSLTQALSDGTNNYIYGVDRIAQVNTGTEYFLGDALGSVRQLTDQSGEVTYASTYNPYGVVTSTVGSSQSAYGFTNEYTGLGIAQITQKEAETAYGEKIKDPIQKDENGRPIIRGYGLCTGIYDYRPQDKDWSAEYMRRRIQMVVDKCKFCTERDIFIVAALAQNGPGFTIANIDEIKNDPDYLSNNQIQWKVWYAGRSRDSETEYRKQWRLFYKFAKKLNEDGYYLPPNILNDEIVIWLKNQ